MAWSSVVQSEGTGFESPLPAPQEKWLPLVAFTGRNQWPQEHVKPGKITLSVDLQEKDFPFFQTLRSQEK